MTREETMNVVIAIPVDQISNFRWIIEDCSKHTVLGAMISTLERRPNLMSIGLDKWCMRYWMAINKKSDFQWLKNVAMACGGYAYPMTREEEQVFNVPPEDSNFPPAKNLA